MSKFFLEVSLCRIVVLACDAVCCLFEYGGLSLRLLFQEEKMMAMRKICEFWLKVVERLRQFIEQIEKIELSQSGLDNQLKELLVGR